MKRLILALALALLLAIPAAAQGILPPLGSGQPGGTTGNPDNESCDAACYEAKLKADKDDAAQSAKKLKQVRHLRLSFNGAFGNRSVCEAGRPVVLPTLAWQTPVNTAVSFYRVSWRVNSGWPSYKDANTRKRGNAFITENLAESNSFTIPVDGWPAGKTLRVRVRAAYEGEENGAWVKVSLPWPCD